jgi:hypothetical protein
MNKMSRINAISVRKIRIVQDLPFSPMEGRNKKTMGKERRKRKEHRQDKSHAQENGLGDEKYLRWTNAINWSLTNALADVNKLNYVCVKNSALVRASCSLKTCPKD